MASPANSARPFFNGPTVGPMFGRKNRNKADKIVMLIFFVIFSKKYALFSLRAIKAQKRNKHFLLDIRKRFAAGF